VSGALLSYVFRRAADAGTAATDALKEPTGWVKVLADTCGPT